MAGEVREEVPQVEAGSYQEVINTQMASKNAVVSLTQAGVDRAGVEALRGISRDASGAIVRTSEWYAARVPFLQARRADLVARIKNVDTQIVEAQAAQSKQA